LNALKKNILFEAVQERGDFGSRGGTELAGGDYHNVSGYQAAAGNGARVQG
jgi:hypothetical protein